MTKLHTIEQHTTDGATPDTATKSYAGQGINDGYIMPTPDPSNVELIGASVIGDILPRLNQKQLRILQCESKLIKLREA